MILPQHAHFFSNLQDYRAYAIAGLFTSLKTLALFIQACTAALGKKFSTIQTNKNKIDNVYVDKQNGT